MAMVNVILTLMVLWIICHMSGCDKRVSENEVLMAFLNAIKTIAVCGMIIALIAILFRS